MTAQPKPAAADNAPALNSLLPLVYDELRRIAHNRLLAEPAGHTLNTTALVHEAYLRLVVQTRAGWVDRSHFLALASTAMRRILIDYARKHRAAKRNHDGAVSAADQAVEERAARLIDLDQALTRLAEVDERLSRVVEYRFFGGLTEEETAHVLGVTSRTVRSDWALAKSILYVTLTGAQSPEGGR